jgi:hypothetical protein
VEAVAPFGLLFTFAARGDEATLVLHRENRALEGGPSAAVLEAVTGVPLGPSDLRLALTGCAASPDVQGVRQLGAEWRLVPDGERVLYLRREPPSAPWRVAAVVTRDARGRAWRAEYSEFDEGLPVAIRLAGDDGRRFDLRLALSQVDVNLPLGPEVFVARVPPSAVPISLEELRAEGPLAADSAGDR